MPENNSRLAEAVRDWVEQRGLTQPVISARGGPSSTTMTKVLTGTGSFAPSMFRKLDQGLGWGEGTAERHWRGEALAAGVNWRDVSDQELVDELSRRLANRGEGGTNAEAAAASEKTPVGGGVGEPFLERGTGDQFPDQPARRDPRDWRGLDLAADIQDEAPVYEQLVERQDQSETGNQDDRGEGPA